MLWQDAVMMVAQFSFAIALIPTIKGGSKPPLVTSFATAILLCSVTLCFATLSLWLSAVATSTATLAWFIVAGQTLFQKKKRGMLIYVAGPLSGKKGKHGDVDNVGHAIEVAEQLYELGHHTYVPHLSLFQSLILAKIRPGYTPTYKRWLPLDLDVISRCDALFHFAHSPGADQEKAYAESISLPVYTRMEDVPIGEIDMVGTYQPPEGEDE